MPRGFPTAPDASPFRRVFLWLYCVWALLPMFCVVGSFVPNLPPHRLGVWWVVSFLTCGVPVVLLPFWRAGAFWSAMAVLGVGWVGVGAVQAYLVYVLVVQGGEPPDTDGSPMAVVGSFMILGLFLFTPITALLGLGVAAIFDEWREKSLRDTSRA